MIVATPPLLARLYNRVHPVKTCVFLCLMLFLGTAYVATDVHWTSCGSGLKEAQIELSKLQQGVQQYQIMNNRELPGSLEDLAKQKFVPKVPKDPWNNNYYYFITTDKTYLLFSAGPDGLALTEDDIQLAE